MLLYFYFKTIKCMYVYVWRCWQSLLTPEYLQQNNVFTSFSDYLLNLRRVNATRKLKKRFENTNLPVREVECQWIEKICTQASSILRKREVVVAKHSCYTRAQVARVQRTKWCHAEFEIILTGISGAPRQCVTAFTIKQSMAWIFIVDQPEW